MNRKSEYQAVNKARVLYLVLGTMIIIFAILYNQFVISLIQKSFSHGIWKWISSNLMDVEIPFFLLGFESDQTTPLKIRQVQICFFIVGFMFIFLSEVAKRVLWIKSFTNKDIVLNISISVLSVILPIFILESALFPFHKPKTTIFIPDKDLGWKLKPNAEDMWGGVKVKINSKGLTGPELDYAKSPDVKRILFLGDSVTFGFKLESYDQSFPYQIETVLEKALQCEIETINSGVGGYSPWQEYIYLKREGIKYDPDLIVVSFVLNDVTEKFHLAKFGGTEKGFQLMRTAHSNLEKLISKSAILTIGKRIYARIRFGKNIQKGAQWQEVVDIKSILLFPDHQKSKDAWKITLANMSKIFDFCKTSNIPAILIIFPFNIQLEDPGLSAPQKTLINFAQKTKTPTLDLLPVLHKKLKDQGLKPDDYFLDFDHPSAYGSKVIAELIADFVLQNDFLKDCMEKGDKHRP